MEPIQKPSVPKKHPLQFNTKSDKPIKQIKQSQQIKVEVKPTQDYDIQHLSSIKTKEKISQECIQKQQSNKSSSIKKLEVKQIKIEENSLKSQDKSILIKIEAQQKNELKQNQSLLKNEKIDVKIQIKKEESDKLANTILAKEAISKQLTFQIKKQQKQIAFISKQQIGQKQGKQVQRHPVKIQINDSSQKGTALLKYTLYHITGQDNHGSFAISRKYEQFEALSAILHERWPGCFVPSISQQSDIKNLNQREKHKRFTLANFLIGLSYSTHLYYREQVQLFLRSPDVNVIQMFQKMPPLKTKDVISRFKSSFGEAVQATSSPDNATFIKKFIGSLRKVINSLGTLSSKALALSQAYDNYSQCMSKFGKIQKTYQQFCLSEYTDSRRQKAILLKDSENKIDHLQDLCKHNPFYKLYSYLSNQVKDAEAFLEVIIASELFVLKKDDLEKEAKQLQTDIESIVLGHKSLKVMASRKSKEQVQAELQQKQKKVLQNKDTMIEMFNILEILLATKSIALFKSYKRNNYKAILLQWLTFSSQTSPEIEAVWQFIAEESKNNFKL